jgi:hypothetical protein
MRIGRIGWHPWRFDLMGFFSASSAFYRVCRADFILSTSGGNAWNSGAMEAGMGWKDLDHVRLFWNAIRIHYSSSILILIRQAIWSEIFQAHHSVGTEHAFIEFEEVRIKTKHFLWRFAIGNIVFVISQIFYT